MSDEPSEAALAPFIIEGARSSRSRCKTCRRAIERGLLRLGVLIEGPYGTGYLWHHLTCVARRRFEYVEEAYGLEAWKAAKEPPAKLPDLEELRALRDVAEERRQQRKQIPFAELAPTGRSRCKHCGRPIEQGTVRIVLGRGVSFGDQVRTAPHAVHPSCVAETLQGEECTTQAAGLADLVRSHSPDLSEEQLQRALGEVGPLP